MPTRLNSEPSILAGVASCRGVRFTRQGGASYEDLLAVEEPLEIRLAGEPLATTMRTPGQDRELALGFLLSEGIVKSVADVGSVVHCGRPADDGYGNILDILPGPGTAFSLEGSSAARRGTLTTSACGVCGRRSIDDLLQKARPVQDATCWSPDVISTLPNQLRQHQKNFEHTGGLHAAAVFDSAVELLAVYEDVGRHNAVDKCVGRLLLESKVRSPGLALVVSGRSSFEIVHKAIMAGIGLIVSVSAPSTLAVLTAERGGVALTGFTRDGSFNVYAHASRIGP